MLADLVLVLVGVAATPPSDVVDRYALVVGVNRTSDDSREPLRFADDDAARFFELFAPSSRQAHLLTVFDADSQETFAEQVSLARPPKVAVWRDVRTSLREAIEETHADGRRAELVVYWAGHGDVRDGVGYVHLVDGVVTRPEFRAQVLEGLGADFVHVIVDACKSYYLVAGRGPGGRREPQPTAFAGPDPIPGVGYVLSTSSDAEAHEWSELRGGVFSHEVRSALLGAGDADGDGHVDYLELGAFISTANAAIPIPAYRPAVYVRPPDGASEQPIYAPRRARGAELVLGANDDGRVRITDGRGFRYVDLHKTVGSTVTIQLLQPRLYEVDWNGARRSIPAQVGSVRLSGVRRSEVTFAQRGQIHRAFEHLFDVPFSGDVVRGYRLAARDYEEPTLVLPAERTPPSRLQTTLVLSGLALVAGGAALAIASATTRGAIATAPQIDRPGLATRSNAYLGASAAAFGVGLSAIGVGWLAFD